MFYMPYIWSKFFMTLCGNIILLIIICLLLWGNTSSDYAIIIYNETREWSEGALLDVIAIPAPDSNLMGNDGFDNSLSKNNSHTNGDRKPQDKNFNIPKCPLGYKILSGTFYGTNKICYVSKPDANPDDVD